MSFAKITGQKLAIDILKKSIIQDRLSHAYLFTGASGTEKKLTAIEFAKAINCEVKEKDSCDSCLSCRKINNSNHPDIKFINPDGNYIKIDMIRDMQREIIYRPYESNKKIYIISNIELLTSEAANSLLKILEEPPEYIILILLTDDIEKILATIISRCQTIRFNKINKELLINKLSKNYNLDSNKAKLIANLSGGSFDRAIKLVEDEDLLATRDNFIEYIINLNKEDLVKLFKIIEKILAYKEEIDYFFEVCLTFYRDLLFFKLKQNDLIINFDYISELKVIASNFKLDDLEKAINIIEETNNIIKTKNVNLKLTLEALFISLKDLGGEI